METLWKVHLLGGLHLCSERLGTLPRALTHKSDMLLAYLAYHRQRAHPREELIDLMWPSSEPAAGRLNLRVALTALRRRLELPGIAPGILLLTDPKTVQLNPQTVSTDVGEFEASLDAAARTGDADQEIQALRRAIALYRGELLPGYYEDWISLERIRLADSCLTALNRLSALLQETGDIQTAIEYAHQAVAVDGFSEEAHLRLIQLYAAAGRPAAALQQYQALEQTLRQELNTRPSAAITRFITELVEQTKLHPFGAHSAQSRSSAPVQPADAVQARSGRRAPSHAFFYKGTLPLTLTRFFGREAEIARIEDLLDPKRKGSARLLTLIGLGGCGKTRLAVEAAARLRERYAGAVWFVSLEELNDPARILVAIAETLGILPDTRISLVDQIAFALSRQPALLVLDNLEHLIQEETGGVCVLQQIRGMLSRSGKCRFLITSRQRLDMDGEHTLRVRPLPVPDTLISPESLEQVASVQLFVDRARHSRPDFELTAENASDIAALCARLDGIPLAIELAAAWSPLLTPAQMREQLGERLERLVAHRKDALSRHRSLLSVLEASYRMLSPSLQHALACLSVFRGSFDLEAVEAVCEEPNALQALMTLQERSLIVATEQGQQMRYHLLETVRAFARSKLTEKEQAALHDRHATTYLAMAETGDAHLRGPQQSYWLEHLRLSYAETEAALEWIEHQESGLRLAAALPTFWQVTGRLQEGHQWLARTLEANPEAPAALRAKALLGAASLLALIGEEHRAIQWFQEACALLPQKNMAALRAALQPLTNPGLLHAFQVIPVRLLRRLQAAEDAPLRAFVLTFRGQRAQWRNNYTKADALLRQGLALYREMGDRQGMAVSLRWFGDMAIAREDYAEAGRCWEESLRLYRQIDDQFGIAAMLHQLAYLYGLRGNLDRAECLAQEAVERFQRMGSRMPVAYCLWNLGNIARRRGDYDRARSLLEESLHLIRQAEKREAGEDILFGLGALTYETGDFATARRYFREALDSWRRRGDTINVGMCLCALADVERQEQNTEQAETLYREALALGQAKEAKFIVAGALLGLGWIACGQGDLNESETLILESLTVSINQRNRRGIVMGLEALAEVRRLEERPEAAARIYGCACALREEMGVPLPLCERRRCESALAALKSRLGVESFTMALERGRALQPQEAATSF
ncbi:MAG TPA: tetratricopeptide repeat protein [Chthonomonadaceae bacterium]|nr:tetratricopeptide repeat protein [Chthonomonadaceae bacterium]